MSSTTQPCHKDNFFFDAIEEARDAYLTTWGCHICFEAFDESLPDIYDDPYLLQERLNLLLLTVLPFDFRKGYDLTRHTPVQLRRCGHVFGLPCLTTWLLDGSSTSCPVCREEIIDLDESQDAFGPHDLMNIDWEPEADEDTTRRQMLHRADTNEQRYRFYIADQMSIDDLCQDTLGQYDNENYTVLLGRDDIALLLALWIFIGNSDEDELQKMHDRMMDMALGKDIDIPWLHFMEKSLKDFAKQKPFDPSQHFENVMTLLRSVLKRYNCRHVSPPVLFAELRDELSLAIEEHSMDFPNHLLVPKFIDRAQRALHYFVAWWKMLGHVYHPTRYDPQPAEISTNRGFSHHERVHRGFRRIDRNDLGPTLNAHLQFYGGLDTGNHQGTLFMNQKRRPPCDVVVNISKMSL